MKHRLKTIEQLLRNEPPACECDACRMDCHIPCWGTPEQIRRIIDAGYGDRLALDVASGVRDIFVLAPAVKTFEGKMQPFDPYVGIVKGGCTFWNLDGLQLCALHDQGLKPLEGRMSHHHPRFHNGDWIRDWIAAKWNTDEGRQLVAEWRAGQVSAPLTGGDLYAKYLRRAEQAFARLVQAGMQREGERL